MHEYKWKSNCDCCDIVIVNRHGPIEAGAICEDCARMMGGCSLFCKGSPDLKHRISRHLLGDVDYIDNKIHWLKSIWFCRLQGKHDLYHMRPAVDTFVWHCFDCNLSETEKVSQ